LSKVKGHLKLAVAFIPTLVAIILVFYNFRSLGLSFWDEYNYLTTAKWFLGRSDGVFLIYEPPGYPLVIALFFRLFGIGDYQAILACGIFAVMLVTFLTIVGARFFGLEVAVFSSILLALSPLLLTFSRLALTDVPFAFFFSAFVVTAYVALKTKKPIHLMLAAFLLVGCSGMKYNSFMALLLPLLYVPIMALGSERGERLSTLFRNLKLILMIFLPTMLAGLGFLFLLGVGGSIHGFMSARIVGLLTRRLVSTFHEGIQKFIEGAYAAHASASQFNISPLLLAPQYLFTLTYWVPLPLFALAALGMPRSLKDSPNLFVAFWLIVGFLEISSIPQSMSNMSRAMLPILPPLFLMAAIGIKRTAVLFRLILTKLRRGVSGAISLTIPIIILLLIIAMGITPAMNSISIYHNGYRQTAEVLRSKAAGSAVIAQTQLVLLFYYPVDFATGRGPLNASSLSGYGYLVVDFETESHGYTPAILKLREEGRLQLVASIPNQIPPVVYTDSFRMDPAEFTSFNSTIDIYRITNATSAVQSG
jgi:4-amino-4-deoxy-L-arabinose transferase-like glycosyltransferase